MPAYLSAASAIFLILHIIALSKPVKAIYARILPSKRGRGESQHGTMDPIYGLHPASFFGQFKEHISTHGGVVIYAFKFARLLGCLALLAVSLATLILEETGEIDKLTFGVTGKHWGKKHKKHRHRKHGVFSDAEWTQGALCVTSVRNFEIWMACCN